MPVTPQPRPKARCPECGTVSIFAEHINRRCATRHKLPDGNVERCAGTFQGAVEPGDWNACPDCGTTGVTDDGDCPHCAGAGWLYAR